jgi:ABC-type multidrug transport system fused ATPase/permease subunit
MQHRHDSGKIEFDNVDFTYEDGNRVTNFNLKLTGEKLPWSGPLGRQDDCCKSAARFFEPVRRNRINGQDIASYLACHPIRVGIVPQTPHLFSDCDNIRYGRLNASDEEIAAASRPGRTTSLRPWKRY